MAERHPALRHHSPLGLGGQDWCLRQGLPVRADTHADNKIMQHILEKNGFTKCGIIHVADGTPRIAYQRLSREGAAR